MFASESWGSVTTEFTNDGVADQRKLGNYRRALNILSISKANHQHDRFPQFVDWCNIRLCPGGGTGRRKGLKIPRAGTPVPVRFRPRALNSDPYLASASLGHLPKLFEVKQEQKHQRGRTFQPLIVGRHGSDPSLPRVTAAKHTQNRFQQTPAVDPGFHQIILCAGLNRFQDRGRHIVA